MSVQQESPTRVSVVVPVRNEGDTIARLVRTVLAQDVGTIGIEVVVVDDGSTDHTATAAEQAGARVLRLPRVAGGGNPARARNRGARMATGDPLVFLDADCLPREGWLRTLLKAHENGATIVGGALALPPGLPLSARCDFYCGWYNVHPGRPAGSVRNHPPGNLSVRRDAFLSTSGFVERQPIAFAHEELRWQAELARAGHPIAFEPRAVVDHYNRPGWGNLLRRNYRWAYSAIESKAETGAARFRGLYEFPHLLVLGSVPLSLASTGYVLQRWVAARKLEPVLLFPAVLAARTAYAAGMAMGGIRWLRSRGSAPRDVRPRWE